MLFGAAWCVLRSSRGAYETDPFFGPIVPNIDCVHPYDREIGDFDGIAVQP